MSNINFFRVYPNAIPPMKAEKSALGNLPTAGFQYCEPVRTASALGWLIFPPKDIRLKFDGHEVLVYNEEIGSWERLEHIYFEAEFWQHWDKHTPESMAGVRIPYLSTTFHAGLIQIWSGLLVETALGYSTHVRPLANVFGNSSYVVYEGIVRTDTHKPWPLFGNIRLVATDREIVLHRNTPLFQVQVVANECIDNTQGEFSDVFGNSDTEFDRYFNESQWAGLNGTVRDIDPTVPRRVGEYAATTRKKAKLSK